MCTLSDYDCVDAASFMRFADRDDVGDIGVGALETANVALHLRVRPVLVEVVEGPARVVEAAEERAQSAFVRFNCFVRRFFSCRDQPASHTRDYTRDRRCRTV